MRSTAAGLQYFNPHSIRNTLTQLGETVCQTPEAFKAWSQNLGHERVLTTFFSYGEVATRRQGEIIRILARDSQTAGGGHAWNAPTRTNPDRNTRTGAARAPVTRSMASSAHIGP